MLEIVKPLGNLHHLDNTISDYPIIEGKFTKTLIISLIFVRKSDPPLILNLNHECKKYQSPDPIKKIYVTHVSSNYTSENPFQRGLHLFLSKWNQQYEYPSEYSKFVGFTHSHIDIRSEGSS
jgi:hypothetical protein